MRKTLLFVFLFVGALTFSVSAQSMGVSAQTGFESGDKKDAEISISVFNNRLYVFNAPENSYLEVRNMLGEKVFESPVNNTEKEEFYLNLKKGFYIVKLGNTLQRIVIK